jgi:hypothetical protein
MALNADSPLEVFREWFDKLPPDFRTDLSQRFFYYSGAPQRFFPALPVNSETLRTVLHGKPEDPVDEAVTVVILAALVDFLFVDRSTKKQWEEEAAFLKGALRFAQERDSSLPLGAKAASELPFGAAMWIREAENWNDLRSGPLSMSNLYRWMDRARLSSFAKLPK